MHTTSHLSRLATMFYLSVYPSFISRYPAVYLSHTISQAGLMRITHQVVEGCGEIVYRYVGLLQGLWRVKTASRPVYHAIPGTYQCRVSLRNHEIPCFPRI